MNTEDRLRRIEGKINGLSLAVICLVVIVGWLFIERVSGQEIGKWVPTPAEAVGWALGDLAGVAEADRPFQRYVWLPPWADERWIAAVNFSVNTAASHASVIRLANPAANGWLMRYDLRVLAPSISQLQKLVTTWDGLALQDSYFHVTTVNSGIAAAVLAPHLRQREAVALAGLSLSTGAIYRADFLLVKMLSTIEGGQYYDFQQVQRVVAKGSTPQAVWLASLGFFEKTTKDSIADQRSGLTRSEVTGKPRRIDAFYGIGRGGPLATITHDIGNEDIDPSQHPLRNLIVFDDRGREAIATRRNGTHAFALFDDSGRFVDSVPDTIASDNTVPSPHPKILHAAISCIRCHGPHGGLQPFKNDAAQLLGSGLDALDLAALNLTRQQADDILASLYSENIDAPDSLIGRARRDYSKAVYRIVGGAYGDADVVSAVSAHVSQIYASHRYDMLTPERACLELGLAVPPGSGTAGIEQLFGPKVPGAFISLTEATLRTGESVNRSDFDHDYPDLALKANRNRKAPKQ